MREEKDNWFVEIEKIDNGYILKRDSDERGIITKVFQIKDSVSKEELNKLEKEELMKMFGEIQEHFGIINFQSDKYHLSIKVVKVKE